ncbi:MAG: alpha/beta fold hydrolase [Candidatus Promineifilaceae bacterium]|jgi:pimeloyl-ACP methyl ester carboxylesterase
METRQQITLDDGRILGFAEYGQPQGRPIIFFHGWPSSRLEARMLAATAHKLEIRLIAPDRPGFGLSSFQPGRRLLDWPADVLQLAGALGLERFAVLGVSGGGPFAAVCALKIPERLRAAGIVSGLGPLDAPGALEQMRPLNRRLATIGRRAPWLFRLVAWPEVRALKRDPEGYFARAMADMPGPDRAALARGEIRSCLQRTGQEAFQAGLRGAAWENALTARPWGFRLEDIAMEVHLWHGELDRNAPAAMGRYVAAAIPNCQARFYEDEGHLSVLVNHAETILGAVNTVNK